MAELEDQGKRLEHELASTRQRHVQETEATWHQIKRLTAVPQPLSPPDMKAYNELQAKFVQLETLASQLLEENDRIKGRQALHSAGISPQIGSLAMLALHSPLVSARSSPKTPPSGLASPDGPVQQMVVEMEVEDSDLQIQVERLHQALVDSYHKVRYLVSVTCPSETVQLPVATALFAIAAS